MQDTDLMLHTLLELGESMLADGADVRRVEQTLSRMGKAYGAVRMDVFVITSSIVLTMCFADGSAATQTRRIEKSAMTDFGKLEAINAISRSYCEHPFPVPELYDRLQLAKRCEPARWKLFAGSCLAAGALAAFSPSINNARRVFRRHSARRTGRGTVCAGSVRAADRAAAAM